MDADVEVAVNDVAGLDDADDRDEVAKDLVVEVAVETSSFARVRPLASDGIGGSGGDGRVVFII